MEGGTQVMKNQKPYNNNQYYDEDASNEMTENQLSNRQVAGLKAKLNDLSGDEMEPHSQK